MKKAFLKTMEALLAVVVSFMFLLIIIPNNDTQPRQTSSDVLLAFESDTLFRSCVLAENNSCVDSYIQRQLPGIYEYQFLITDDPNEIIDLPEHEVIQESLFLAGNATHYDPTIIRLFYWSRRT